MTSTDTVVEFELCDGDLPSMADVVRGLSARGHNCWAESSPAGQGVAGKCSFCKIGGSLRCLQCDQCVPLLYICTRCNLKRKNLFPEQFFRVV
jgi:hypothetical protein